MASDPGPREPVPEWVRKETEEWDRITALTPRVGRFIAAFIPTWFVVLLLLGLTGGALGPLFVLGTGITALIAWRIERRWTAYRRRGGDDPDARPPGRRRPLGPVAGMLIGAGFILLVVYMVFVLRTAA